MSQGCDIDIPITNLDEDEDDLSRASTDDFDSNVFREDFDLENDESPFHQNEDTLVTKLRQAIHRFTSGGYNKIYKPHSAITNGIAIRDFNADDFSDLSDDDDLTMMRRKPRFPFLILSNWKQYLVYTFILSLLTVVIVLGALLYKGKKDSQDENSSIFKTILSNGTHSFYPTTILISLDGFHPHYISAKLTPNLHNIFISDYGTPYMVPSFPSSTFPNHWTIATGLYPQYHGIVGNTFYDPERNEKFINVVPSKSMDPHWWGGEPIWTTAEFQGVRSAIHMYPGSEVIFPDGNPTEVDRFNKTELLEVKVNRFTEWLDRGFDERPELIIGYVPTIDTLGHRYGIYGQELREGLNYVDDFIGNMTNVISERNLTDIVNLIIVSDHGMAPTSNKRLIFLDELVNITKIQHIDGWPLYGLRPYAEFSIDDIYDELISTYNDSSSHYHIYLRENLPQEWNFGGKAGSLYYDRIAPIWIIPDVGYSITTHDFIDANEGKYTPKGVHGYNNTEPLMRALFLGSGPFFKSQSMNAFKVKPFKNIEVYNIVCETLGLKPSLNNGTEDIFGERNRLETDWKDEIDYPGVLFKVGGILKENATYDELFRSHLKQKPIVLEPSKSETAFDHKNTKKISQQNQKETKTKSTIIATKAKEKSSDKSSIHTASSNSIVPSLTSTSYPEKSKTNNGKDRGDDSKKTDDGKKPNKNHRGKPEGTQEESAKKHKGQGKNKAFWGEIVDEAEHVVEEIYDEIEDIAEDIEAAIHQGKKQGG